MTALRTSLYALVLLAFAAGSAFVPAQAHPHGTARAIVLAEGGMSLDEAVKMAEERFKARVVRAEAQQEDGRTIYVLRLLNDSGRVWTVRIDAASGALL
jgi:uncharacterized membrane protein YkoI